MRLHRNDRRHLRALFGHHARFDETERALYRQDIWRTPAGFRMLLKRDVPDAVVLPESEAELVELVRFASEKEVALTPRGGGTDGHGGATPVVGGIVVDLSGMEVDFDVDPETGDTTASGGMTFHELALRLAQEGRALAVEPFFPDAATLGGWLAAGGGGHGSARYGLFPETVKQARVVLADGSRRIFSGSELDVIAEACGTTGFITSVTLRTRDIAPPVPFVVSYGDLQSFQAALPRLQAAAPWWTFVLETPETVALKAEALGAKAPARNAFVVTAAVLPADATADVKATIASVVEETGGKEVPAKQAEAWWAVRDEVFRAKALGPSIVVQQVLVPTAELPRAIAQIKHAVRAGHWLMTAFLAGERSHIVGYALDDERRPTHNASYGAAIAMLDAVGDIAGARPASTGLLNAGRPGRVFPAPRLERLGEFKAATDPSGVMNPGKVFATPMKFKPMRAPGPSLQMALAPGAMVLKRMHGSTWVQYQRREEARGPAKAGLSAALGMAGGGRFGNRWAWDVAVSDSDLALRHAGASARAFAALSSSPYGWLQWIKSYLYDRAAFTAHQFQMLHGEGIAAEAELRSRYGVPFADLFMDLKAQLHADGYPPLAAHERARAELERTGNRFGESQDARGAWADGLDLPAKGATLLFVDDLVSYKAPAFARRSAELLKAVGMEVATLGAAEPPSGALLFATGQDPAARSALAATVKAVGEAGAREVITLDPWTHHVLVRVYPRVAAEMGLKWDVKVRHIIEVLAEQVKAKKLEVPAEGLVDAALHHPPVLTLNGVGEEMAEAVLPLFGVRAVRLLHHGRDAWDVGASPGVVEAFPEVASRAARFVLGEAAQTSAGRLVSTDPASALVLAGAQRADAAPGEGLPSMLFLGERMPSGAGADPGGAGEADAGDGESGAGDAEEEAETAPSTT